MPAGRHCHIVCKSWSSRRLVIRVHNIPLLPSLTILFITQSVRKRKREMYILVLCRGHCKRIGKFVVAYHMGCNIAVHHMLTIPRSTPMWRSILHRESRRMLSKAFYLSIESKYNVMVRSTISFLHDLVQCKMRSEQDVPGRKPVCVLRMCQFTIGLSVRHTTGISHPLDSSLGINPVLIYLSFEGHLEKKMEYIFGSEVSATVFLVPFRQFVYPLALAHNGVGETCLKRAPNLIQ